MLQSAFARQPFPDFCSTHLPQVSFTITFAEGKLDEVKSASGGIHKKMKLESSMSTTNMNLFNKDSQIVK